MCLAQVHNAVPPVRLEPATLQSRVKYLFSLLAHGLFSRTDTQAIQ